jgi:succinate dehydrogenase / fumarate reductase cytochrome b subunit
MLTSIIKKTVMALTGVFLSLFIVVHVFGNSTILFGKDAFLSYAAKLHSLGVFISLFEVMLLSMFVIHVLLALQTYCENLYARPERYCVKKTSGGRTPGSRTMPYTGLFILIFLVFHLNDFHFRDETVLISDIVGHTLQRPMKVIFYVCALVALTLHISHGFWSIFQTLGLNHPKYNRFIRKTTILVSLVIGVLFISIPLAVFYYNLLVV